MSSDDDAKQTLTNLRLHLARQSGSSIQAGDAGEFLTRRCLDAAEVAWLHVKQEAGQLAVALRAEAKRPDFLVGLGGTSVLLDAKCLTPLGDDGDDALTFALEVSEIDRLEAAGSIFGLPVAVIIWCRKGDEHRFVVDLIDRFDTACTLGRDGISARRATFQLGEITRLKAS